MSKHEAALAARVFARRAKRLEEFGFIDRAKSARHKAETAGRLMNMKGQSHGKT